MDENLSANARGHRFDPGLGEILRAMEKLSLCAATT